MDLAPDLSQDNLRKVLGDRPFRTYPALLSTEADAQAWARQGGPSGAVVVADYQASPRGRAGFEWTVRQSTDLAFTVVFRPAWSHDREGWIYSVATTALSDVIGPEAQIEWPAEVFTGSELRAAVGAHVELGPDRVDWLVLSVLIRDVTSPRGPALARVLELLERRLAASPDAVLGDHLARCRTIGRRVRARLIPLGPGGPEVTGTARGTLMDGALLVETVEGRRIGIRPQNLGILEDAGIDQIGDASED